jgi:hypothetical protein
MHLPTMSGSRRRCCDSCGKPRPFAVYEFIVLVASPTQVPSSASKKGAAAASELSVNGEVFGTGSISVASNSSRHEVQGGMLGGQ